MTLFDRGPSPKLCFVYCGDDVCDCESSPRYRHWPVPPVPPVPPEPPKADAEVENTPDGTPEG